MENLEKKSLTQKLKQNSKNIFYSLVLLIISGLLIAYATRAPIKIESLDTNIIATSGDELSYKWVNEVNKNKANLNSPAFTGIPTSPKPANNDFSKQIATTERVKAYIDSNCSPTTPVIPSTTSIGRQCILSESLLPSAIYYSYSYSCTCVSSNTYCVKERLGSGSPWYTITCGIIGGGVTSKESGDNLVMPDCN